MLMQCVLLYMHVWRDLASYQGTSTHYKYVMISAMASQITGVSIVYSTVCSGGDQRKHRSHASLTFVSEIVNSPHKGSLTPKMFQFDDLITCLRHDTIGLSINQISQVSAWGRVSPKTHSYHVYTYTMMNSQRSPFLVLQFSRQVSLHGWLLNKNEWFWLFSFSSQPMIFMAVDVSCQCWRPCFWNRYSVVPL